MMGANPPDQRKPTWDLLPRLPLLRDRRCIVTANGATTVRTGFKGYDDPTILAPGRLGKSLPTLIAGNIPSDMMYTLPRIINETLISLLGAQQIYSY
jgi:hypothetical protein